MHNIDSSSTSRRFQNVAKLLAPRAVLFALVAFAALVGALEPLDLALMGLRFRLIQKEPSETLSVVAIDPQSLREEERWPWPRDRYAKAVANLQDAGAELVGFDVDFSSLADEAGDAAFAEALSARPGEIVLPVFAQWTTVSGSRRALVETPPNAKFLQDTIVASVNQTTESNGIARRAWRGIMAEDGYRASMAATLADYSERREDMFYIDYSIPPSKIRRISFRDVLNNTFPEDAVKGKKVLVGATALELGDEFAAPVYGLISGVYLHALSYESMVQGRTLARPNLILQLAFALSVLVFFCPSGKIKNWRRAVGVHVAVFGAMIGAPIAIQYLTPISFDVGAMLAAQILCLIYVGGRGFNRRAIELIRQRAETARFQALTSLVVQDNSDGIIVTDKDGLIELCNDRARELLGVDRYALRGEKIQSVAEEFPVFGEMQSAALKRDDVVSPAIVSAEYAVRKVEGVVLEIVGNCFRYEGATGARKIGEHERTLHIYTLRDVSARKRIEAAEREAKNEAIAASRMKSQLISNMSHELRTPLNGVIGFAGILKDESFGPLGAKEYKDYSESVYISGKRLLDLVNDMLYVAKLDADEVQARMDAAPLEEIIEASLDEFLADLEADEKQVQVDIPAALPLIEADFELFQKMVSYLLSNAVKFTEKGGRIRIRARRNGRDLLLEMADNGCGAPSESLSKLTQAFYQADGALSREHEGTGLGLYIASKFAALHEGEITFKSKEGVGFVAMIHFDQILKAENKQAA